MEKVAYLGQPNCFRLFNGTVEVIVTTDIGPRVIRYGFPGEENIFAELPEASQQTALGEWKPWGGHRLWAAPEAMPRTYSIDNSPIEYFIEGDNRIRLVQKAGMHTAQLEKEITVTLDDGGAGVRVDHRITSRCEWGIELAPWALTIMNGGGMTILPQEPFRSHDDYLLPARPLVMWYFTNLTDPRWSIGERYITLRTDAGLPDPQKIGILNKQGWAAYHREKTLFVKRFGHEDGAVYPDYGSNNEAYTAGIFMELETIGPLRHLEPGEAAEHTEFWSLYRDIEMGHTEDELAAALNPISAKHPAR